MEKGGDPHHWHHEEHCMGYLPTLRREHRDRLVLDAAEQATTVLIGLARAWRADPEAIDALLGELAQLNDCVRDEVHLDGLGHAEHARDQIVEQLLTEAGGTQLHLGPKRDRRAAHQARRIAKEARGMADALDVHANAITIEVENAESERTARQEAELMHLRARLAAIDRGPTSGAAPAGQSL
jgi:hypothetical protein